MYKLTLYLTLIFSVFSTNSINAEDIMGIGAPLIDLIIPIEEEFLETLDINKGDAKIVTIEVFNKILANAEREIITKVGGSCSNTIRALNSLGKKCSIVGMMGADEMGKTFRNQIVSEGIEPKFLTSKTPTGMVACLITPDGERTMPAFPGASLELRGNQISLGLFRNIKHVHFEGYAFSNNALVSRGSKLAKAAGAFTSLDMGCKDEIERHKDEMIEVIKNSIDIAFANEEEAALLTGVSSPDKACAIMGGWCPYAVVLVGKEGCWVGHAGEVTHYPTTPVEVVDTTGAGDFFASGFIYGFHNNMPLSGCARLGNRLGGAVVQESGAEISEGVWEIIRAEIESNYFDME